MRYLIFIFLFCCNIVSSQTNWPFANGHQQAKITGTIGEYRYTSSTSTHRFHKGVDITNGSDYEVYAINSGAVIFYNGGGNWNGWSSYVKVGNVYYYHIKPINNIINYTITNVNVGDKIGDMITTIPVHVHLQEYNTNYLNNELNPYVDNVTPYFFDGYITNGYAFYKNGLIKTTTNYQNLLLNQTITLNSISHVLIYGKIDIVAHVKEPRVNSDGSDGGGAMCTF